MCNDKRFSLAYELEDGGWAVNDYDITLWRSEVIYILNKLHEENVELKSKLKMLEDIDKLLPELEDCYNSMKKLKELLI